ncbi:MAG: response regulator [Cyanobacteria bacterium J06648_16]
MLTQTQTLPQYLLQLAQRQATGELVLDSGFSAAPWKLYLYSGRLIYATGGKHPVRRWYRAFKQQGRQPTQDWLRQLNIPGDYWEVDYINQAIQQKHISLAQAKAIVQSIVSEVMFALVDRPLKSPQWHANRLVSQQTTFLSVERVLIHAKRQQKQCRQASLGMTLTLQQIPDLSPVLRNDQALQQKVSAKGYESLLSWLQGNSTLWDLSIQTRRPIGSILKLLLPLAQQGIIELLPIPDLAAPYRPPTPAPTQPKPVSKGLIACIDDSPVVCKTMAQLLQPMGYEVLPVIEPLQQISTLLKHKPDLIFLDLMMPNVNGYELCSFLRKTSTFQNTPIVILTGRDGMIDRVRTKIAGSSDFLAKPPDAQKVAQIVQKHLEDKEA